jgi:hypothetical protein
MNQIPLPLAISIRKEIDGMEMGVLNDGTSFLSMRALSKMCGIANSTFSDTASQWLAGKRDSKLAQWLVRSGFSRDSLYLKTEIPGVAGNVTYAFTEDICTLLLEYYAFEAPTPVEQAVKNYRTISRAGLRLFIYTAVGYDPHSLVPGVWRELHDRLQLHSVPSGYFGVFREMADFILASIRMGLRLDASTLPDISVGRMWSDYWAEHNLDARFGTRTKHDHNFPDYFPQARSNPQNMWIYPVDAMGEFRRWLDGTYIPNNFPAYLRGKVKQQLLPASAVELILAEVSHDAVVVRALPGAK